MEDQRHTGFTLVELLITLAVIAILAGVAAPAMARFLEQARLRSAADALAQELRQARNHALTYRQPVHFSHSAGSASHWCYGWRQERPCSCFSDAPETGCAQWQRSPDFPAVRFERSAKGHALQFSPVRGLASAASFALRAGEAERRVILSPLGRVRVCAPDGQGAPPC